MEPSIIERVKGNIKEDIFKNLSIDYVDIPWYESGKRILKLVSKKGRSIGIRLVSDQVSRGLLQGDVLGVFDGEAIVVNIVEDECIAVKASDIKTTAKVCYEVGNRHSPLFYSEDERELILPFDKPMLEMLKKLEVDVQVKTMKIHRDKSISSVNTIHSGHNHDNGHSHSHGTGGSHSHETGHSHSHETEHSHSHEIGHSHNHDLGHSHSHDTSHSHSHDTGYSHSHGIDHKQSHDSEQRHPHNYASDTKQFDSIGTIS